MSIVLTTFNAKYIHASFGLRYLLANMGELRAQTRLAEFTIHDRATDIVEALLEDEPRVVGLGVYIWNVELSTSVVRLLKQVAPEVVVVVGGPEVSHELEGQAVVALADYVICGEADLAFAELCARVLSGRRPLQKVVDGGLPDLDGLVLPYALYSEHDLAHRLLYVEASRGCPYRCEFCLSSLDKKVRAFDLDALLAAFDDLLARGARHFKFVDRTFNLDIKRSLRIVDYFLERQRPGLFLHFEMVPDRLPEELRERLTRFAPGTLQFEVGIQSLDPEVGRRIQRRQDLDRTFANLRFLREETAVHVHTDLIAGLPGEGLSAFGEGVNRLVAEGVQEIQIGILKRLRGTPIARHTDDFAMVFASEPPYEVLSTSELTFQELQRLKRFAHVWDRFHNQGGLAGTVRLLWPDGDAFTSMLAFTDWLYARAGKVHAMSADNRARYLYAYLVDERGLDPHLVEVSVTRDHEAVGRRPPPRIAERGRTGRVNEVLASAGPGTAAPARQRRHLALPS